MENRRLDGWLRIEPKFRILARRLFHNENLAPERRELAGFPVAGHPRQPYIS
jgi:hypothetical protein